MNGLLEFNFDPIPYLEVWNVDLLHQRIRPMSTTRASTREDEDFLVRPFKSSTNLFLLLRFWLRLSIWVDKPQVDVLLAGTPICTHIPFRIGHTSNKLQERIACGIVERNNERLHGCIFASCTLALDFPCRAFVFFILIVISEYLLYAGEDTFNLGIRCLILDTAERLVGAEIR